MAFLNEVIAGFGDILKSPFQSLDALWLIIPLLLMWMVLEIYFAKYKREELGWNTALANGITLSWLTLEGMRYLFSSKPADFGLRFTANIVILIYALLIIYFSFTHKIKSKWNFLIASPTPVYFLGVFSVVWGYGTLEVTRYVIIDLAVLFILISLAIKIAKHFITPAKDDKEESAELPPKIPEKDELGGLPSLGGGLEEKKPSAPPAKETSLEKNPFDDISFGEGDDLGELPPL